ncbi:hypothetical protein D3C85_1525940 [compost metagenome]
MQDPGTDGAVDLLELGERLLAVLRLHVDHHVTDVAAGLQVLTGDVDPLFGEDLVDLVHDARLVAVDVQQPAGALVTRQ